jgi:Kef-type K+ transport system membrane component KefB
MLMALNAIYIFVVAICAIAVAVDGPPGSNGNQLYQTLIFIMIITSVFASILAPLVFDKIVAMKFHERVSKLSK